MSSKEPSRKGVFFTKLRQTLSRPYYKKFVEDLQIAPNEKIIDFGSNTGFMAKFIAESLVAEGALLTCIDISKTWIDISRKRLEKFSNVDFILGDITTNPKIKNRFYDRAIIHFVLHDIKPSERKSILEALTNKLRIGGRICIREPTLSWHGISEREIRELMLGTSLKELQTYRGFSRIIVPTFTGTFERAR